MLADLGGLLTDFSGFVSAERSVEMPLGSLILTIQRIEPLMRSQQQLRGRKVSETTDEQLRDWINACDKMETWVDVAKSRRGRRLSGIDAHAELERRNEATKSRLHPVAVTNASLVQ